MKPEIKWGIEKADALRQRYYFGELEVIFHFPYVQTRIIKEKPHTLDGSSQIVDKAIQKFLRRSYNEVQWRYGEKEPGCLQVKLDFGRRALVRKTLEDLSKFIYEFDTFIKERTNKLINPR